MASFKKEITGIILNPEGKASREVISSLSFCDEILCLKTPLITDFAKERNQALKKAKNDWVFFLDSDEIIPPNLKIEIEKIDFKRTLIHGFILKREVIFLGLKIGTDSVLRLANRKFGYWQRAVHEVWQIRRPVKTLKNPLLHITGSNLKDYLLKINYYSSVHAAENLKEGKKANLAKILIFPVGKFWFNILKRRNFVFSLMQGFHSFLAWAKLWFLQKNT